MPEAKLADRAAMYERALQNSVKLRTSSTGAASAQTSTPQPSTSASAAGPMAGAPLDVNSALGESYGDAQPLFGAGAAVSADRTAEEHPDEEFVDGGIMGLLGNIYEQRKTVL